MLLLDKTAQISNSEFKRFRDYIKENCGILIGDGKEYLIESRFARLLAESGCNSFTEFYQLLEENKNPGLRDKVIDAITTHETSWLRDKYPFDILKNEILPLWSKKEIDRKFRIWSCGCSTGQEVYSIAMVIDQFLSANGGTKLKMDNFEILATDISSAVLFLANAGRFDKLSMKRGLPDDLTSKYFKQVGNIWKIDDSVKEPIYFKRFNLQQDFNKLGLFDLIFCRNVMIYFSNEFKTELFGKFARAMRCDSFLILGSAETTFGYSDLFDRFNKENGTYYKIREK